VAPRPLVFYLSFLSCLPCLELGLALTCIVAPAPARAEPAGRPRMSAAVGTGVSFDDAGLARTEALPAFFATGGVFADRLVGFDLAAFATAAQGRYDGTPIDRLALAGVGVLRPGAGLIAADNPHYWARVGRAAGLELGLGLERDGTPTHAGSRWGVHGGARVEFPLPLPGYGSDLRVRLAVRRLEGLYTPTVQTVRVGDSREVYAALVTVF